MEDDEAELVDAVADCVRVGLPIDAALSSWVSGDLARGDETEEQADVVSSGVIRLQAKRRIVVR